MEFNFGRMSEKLFIFLTVWKLYQKNASNVNDNTSINTLIKSY